MAHSLSSQQYHNPNSNNYQQCSPSTNSHATMFNNYHRSHRTDQQQLHGNYQKQQQQQQQQNINNLSRMKLSSLKGKSWQAFGEALTSESSDDETDNEDPLALPTTSTKTRHNRGSFVRLKRRDIPLYGYCPETDPFAIVTCRHCRKILKSTALKRHIDMRHDPMVKLEKISDKYGNAEKIEKIKDAVEKISVTQHAEKSSVSSSQSSETLQKRHRHAQRKSTTSDNSNDPVPMQIEALPQPPPPPPPPIQVPKILQPPTVIAPSESSSASNSPQPRRKKRKTMVHPQPQKPIPVVTTTTASQIVTNNTETFQSTSKASPVLQPTPSIVVSTSAPQQQTIVTATAAPTTCRIIMSSSPPPLAPITTTNEAPPSVWIVTPSPAVIIDGSFVMKPLEAEIDTEIDLKDLKVLKPALKESQAETSTQLTASNWYTTQPRPLALNTFNMRKINTQRYVMATQRKLIELNRTLRQDDKIINAVTKAQPKTWSFIERSQVFIPFRVTH
ncbi:hypothetical protein ACKWTF_016765 [Chironomus riparius]